MLGDLSALHAKHIKPQQSMILAVATSPGLPYSTFIPCQQSRQVTRARLPMASDSLVNFDAPIL
jgi:hypothetical protein